jgi:hypothetical protein
MTADSTAPLPVDRARHLNLLPATSWEYPCPATWRYLSRQKRRAEIELGLEAVIVQDERGLLALWISTHRPVTRES